METATLYKDKTLRKKHMIGFVVDEEERKKIKEIADFFGMTLSAYIRSVAIPVNSPEVSEKFSEFRDRVQSNYNGYLEILDDMRKFLETEKRKQLVLEKEK